MNRVLIGSTTDPVIRNSRIIVVAAISASTIGPLSIRLCLKSISSAVCPLTRPPAGAAASRIRRAVA